LHFFGVFLSLLVPLVWAVMRVYAWAALFLFPYFGMGTYVYLDIIFVNFSWEPQEVLLVFSGVPSM